MILDLHQTAPYKKEPAISDIRQLVYELRPPALNELGLEGAIREAAATLRQNGLKIEVSSKNPLPQLPAAVEVSAYRIAQEAITNVSRHAKAQNCEVLLTLVEEDDQKHLGIEILDNGIGLPGGQSSGVGAHSMRERAEELGGRFTIHPGANGGTHVTALLPFPQDER